MSLFSVVGSSIVVSGDAERLGEDDLSLTLCTMMSLAGESERLRSSGDRGCRWHAGMLLARNILDLLELLVSEIAVMEISFVLI